MDDDDYAGGDKPMLLILLHTARHILVQQSVTGLRSDEGLPSSLKCAIRADDFLRAMMSDAAVGAAIIARCRRILLLNHAR